MNQSNQLREYLASQMHEKHGFPKDVARNMVSRWLKSVKNVRTSPGRDTRTSPNSYRTPSQSKPIAAKA